MSKEKSESKKKQENVCYIGPSFFGSPTGAVYVDANLTTQLEDMIRRNALFAKLVVPISMLPEANANLDNPATAIGIAYKSAKEYIRKEGK